MRGAARLVVAVLLLACVGAVGTARADEAEAASERYRAGQRFYDEGNYDEAIREFKAAYEKKPHPNVLYNIAQAYERLLEYAESVRWFERYLAEAPADAEHRKAVENRLRVLRSLPARVSITTIPEKVRATLVRGTLRFEGETPRQFRVPAGDYELHLDVPGWEAESHKISTELGQPYFYQFRLKRSTSQLTIFTRPRGARVFLDDKLVGETPFAEEVEVGKHRLLLEHPDYPWHRESIDIRPREPRVLEVKLTRPVRSGRTELVVASMVYGGVAMPLLVAAVGSSNPDFMNSNAGIATLVLSSVAGIGAGFLGSFLTTREGIKVGHSSLIIGGGIFGSSLGAGLALGLDLPVQYVYGLSLLGGALGITTTALIVRWKDVMPGTAAIVNSGSFWGTVGGVLMAQSIFKTPSASQWGWFVFGGTGLGILTGSLVAWRVDRTRGHVFMVDLGGFVGTGLGFALGAAVAASSHGDIAQDGARYAAGGMALGLLAAAALSRSYKADLPPVEALLRRKKNGQWAFGLPKLEVNAARVPEGLATEITATLARGTF